MSTSTGTTGVAAPVRTILTMRAREGTEEAFEAAWRTAAEQIRRVPGQVRQELMRDAGDPRSFSIVSDWADRASVDAFGRSSARESLTEALREMREEASRATFTVIASVPALAPPPVRVDFSTSVRPGEEEAFERAYLLVSSRVAGAKGNVREELLRDEQGRYHIFAEWESEADFTAWVDDPAHLEDSGPLARWLSVDFQRQTHEIRQRPAKGSDFPEALTAPGGDRDVAVRVDFSTSVRPGEEEAFERAYLLVSSRVAGAKGNVREELLRDEQGRYHIFAEWESEADFTAWVDDPAHLEDSGPLARWLSVDFQRQTLRIRQRPGRAGTAGTAGTAAATGTAGTTDTADTTDGERPQPQDVLHADGVPTEVLAAAEPAMEALAGDPVRVEVGQPPVDEPAAVAPATAPARSTDPPARTTDAVEVLVVGAGPAGLTHAIELARRGIAVHVVDKRAQASTQADKAIGIHCRTMEIWERQGVVAEAMAAGTWLHGQTVFVNRRQTHQVDWSGLPELPYAHLGLPQYDTERILGEKAASVGVRVERGTELTGFTQDADGVTSVLRSASGEERTVRSQYLVGCDGAHSAVRQGLGLTFEGGLSMFPQLFMLGDVDLDWDMPAGHLLRFVRIEEDGDFTGMLVCVPLKGAKRYRVATIAPPRLQKTVGAGVVKAGFWQEYDPPGLADIQQVVTELAPEGTRASNLRWSSVFRIKHGIVDRYRVGRAFVAGDAAHLHPPAGGQGMNTGIQDAWNLGWKLALAVRGHASPGLLDSYQAERRPAGKAIVDRAVNLAFTDEMDMEDEKAQFLLEMQMTMNYAGSPLVGEHLEVPAGGPEPGHRAPDALGLVRFGVAHPIRLFDVVGGTRTSVVLYADDSVSPAVLAELDQTAGRLRSVAPGLVDVHLVLSPDVAVPPSLQLPYHVDADRQFRKEYDVSGSAAYVVRPDGHVGFRSLPLSLPALREHLGVVLA